MAPNLRAQCKDKVKKSPTDNFCEALINGYDRS